MIYASWLLTSATVELDIRAFLFACDGVLYDDITVGGDAAVLLQGRRRSVATYELYAEEHVWLKMAQVNQWLVIRHCPRRGFYLESPNGHMVRVYSSPQKGRLITALTTNGEEIDVRFAVMTFRQVRDQKLRMLLHRGYGFVDTLKEAWRLTWSTLPSYLKVKS